MIKTSREKIYSFWNTIHVFYIVVKVLGYVSFSIDGKVENGKIKTTFWDILILFFASCIFAAVIYLNVANNLTLISTKSFVIDSGNRLVNLTVIINVLLALWVNAYKRREIWSIFKEIYEVDKAVRTFVKTCIYSR